MASSSIDTLMQLAAPPRAPEPAARAGGDAHEFQPVLDHAMRSEEVPAADDDVLADADYGAEGPVNEAQPRDDAEEAPHEAESAQLADEVVTESSDDDNETEATDSAAQAGEAAAIAIPTVQPQPAVDEIAVLAVGKKSQAVTDSGNSNPEAAKQKSQTSTPPGNAKQTGQEIELGDVRQQPFQVVDQQPVTPTQESADAVDEQGATTNQLPTATTAESTAEQAASKRTDKRRDRAPADAADGSSQANLGEHSAPGATDAAAAELAENDDAPDSGEEAAADDDGQPTAQPRQSLNAEQATSQELPAVDASTASPATAPAVDAAEAASSPAETAATGSPVAATAEQPAPPRAEAALARLQAERSLHNPSTADDAGGVDRARFIGRVEGAIRAAHDRDGRIQVRLSPPELGALRIELTVQHGILSARLEAETPAARNLLLENLPALRERLAQQDVRVEQFDVDVRRDGGSSGGHQNGPQDQPTREPRWQQRSQRPAAPVATTASGPRTTQTTQTRTDAALDVRI